MRLRRLSLKRCLLYTGVAMFVSLFLLLNLYQDTIVTTFSASSRAFRRQDTGIHIAWGIQKEERNVSNAGVAIKTADSSKISTRVALDSDAIGSTERRNNTLRMLRSVERPEWFLSIGKWWPRSGSRPPIWPDETDDDRIINQLMYRPLSTAEQGHSEGYGLRKSTGHKTVNDVHATPPQLKTILLYDNFGPVLKMGQSEFISNRCPVNTCRLTSRRSLVHTADAVVFKTNHHGLLQRRNPDQVWIIYLLECPQHTARFVGASNFNWTATYRHDSDIVAPYEKWVYYNDALRFRNSTVNYALGKKGKVAWFVSNCGAANNRLEYAKELAKHIEVDIFGACGTKACPRSRHSACFEMLNSEYKFYLAFENANCRDYITEKLFVNGLKQNVLPIVMGAHPDDYQRATPEHSYIHVDDFESPAHLAAYLRHLDADDRLYNEYFRWKGSGEFINTFFFCRLCAALHAQPLMPRKVPDLERWWRPQGVCTPERWRPSPTYT